MKIESHPARMLYGIETRTSNENPHEISALWQRFKSEDMAEDIPERVCDNLIAAYLDYEGDHTNPYTFFVGCEVIDACCAEEGCVLREIPAGDYAVFHAQGKMPAALIETWRQIRASDLNRTFVADFEIHDPENPDSIAIHVGVVA